MYPKNLLTLIVSSLGFLTAGAAELESIFRDPPVSARPYVWWHWMGPNFSKEGITKDLEAMKAAGIGGATIFNITSAVQESHKPTLDNPWPDQSYRSPKYWEAMKHAADQAARLGLELGLHNTVGYSTTGGPWIDEARNMRQIAAKSVTVEGGKRITVEIPRPDPVVYDGWGRTGKQLHHFTEVAVIAAPAEGDIDPSKVIDLTNLFRDGRLDWDAPAGKWQVFRLCSVPTGATPHPLPDELIGKVYEVDKMSLEHNRFHWDQVIDPMKRHLGGHVGKTFRHFLIDSYEAGQQNWTDGFREEFQKRKGYDPLPWLLTLKGRQVGDAGRTARFQWDFKDVVSTLYYEHGWSSAHEKIKEVGMELQFEPYSGPFDTVEGTALADLPMGEFWTGGGGGISSTIVAAARAAGRTVVGAEAFTGRPEISQWTETPAFLKQSADGTFASGVNRMVLHHWVHQPFDDRYKPGMGMGWWGTHFGRHQTWARDGAEFYRYLGRCQALLQAGEAPADFVSVGKHQGGDLIPWRVFRDGLTVRDGRIVLPSGRSYPFLGVHHDGVMSPADLRRISELLERGAVIVCSKPTRTPGLSGYPQSERELAELSAKLWNGREIQSVGKGRLHTHGDIQSAIREAGITPLVAIRGSSDVVSTARVTDGADLYFLANRGVGTAQFTASFRTTDKRPELWDAEAGTMRLAPVWRQVDGRTEVDLVLNSVKSVFVVFRSAVLPADHVVYAHVRGKTQTVAAEEEQSQHLEGADVPAIAIDAAEDGSVRVSSPNAAKIDLTFASGRKEEVALPSPTAATTLMGPWNVTLDSPVDQKRQLNLADLADLSHHHDPAVKSFSGTATYVIDFERPETTGPLRIDLGAVHDLARVTLNGRDLGVLWHPPFVVDPGSALKPGNNRLEIAVTNTWHNRLVGDEQFPADFEWGEDRGDKGRMMKGYPDWFLKNQPRPEQGRKCFVVWYYHRKDTPLLPAGLLGPVKLIPLSTSSR